MAKGALAKDDYIYLIYGRTSNYKYNVSTDTYTKIADRPSNFDQNPGIGQCVIIGDYIYTFISYNAYSGSELGLLRYNISTNTWEQLEAPPMYINGCAAVAVGTDIYIIGGGNPYNNRYPSYIYKYDTTLNTYVKLSDNVPYESYYGGVAVTKQSDIYLLGGVTSDSTYDFNINRILHLAGKSYETDNTVVLAEGTTYSTELFDTNFEEGYKPKYNFSDAFFYTTQDGLDGTMPVYYGNGTQWINIKNPPQNQNS